MAQIWQGKTILVVDDSPLMQEELAEIYRELGLQVSGFAASGVEAIVKYERNPSDLISMDIVMPEMHGIDCFRKLRNRFPDVRVMFVSCLASDHIIGEHFKEEIPSYAFVGKPIVREQLQASLAKVLAATELPPPSKDKDAAPQPPAAKTLVAS